MQERSGLREDDQVKAGEQSKVCVPVGRSLLQLLHLQGHHRADCHATQTESNAATTAGAVKVAISKFGRIILYVCPRSKRKSVLYF